MMVGMKVLAILLIITLVFCVGCIQPQPYKSNTIETKNITVINNVRGQWGDFCSCSILADDGIVYTADKESCVKLPIGMNATIVSDLESARWTGYQCAIMDVKLQLS
jgi:hypothetical protein